MKKEYYKTLIDKYFDNTLTQSELKILIEWIKDDLNLAQWFEEGLNNSDNTIDAALCDKMFSKIRSEVFTENNIAETEIAAPTMKKKWSWMQWAAVFLIPLSVALFTTAVYLSQRSDISTLIVKAERGDKATITLPDGTCVILNSSSQLDYYSDYGSKERRVRLEGEGFFDVITDKDHTFVVQVSELEIKVLGTIFNVSAYHNDSEVDVVLLEGLVEVLTLDAKSILQPNERLTYNKETNKITTQKVSGIDYVTWTKGNLYFENETLKNIMQTLSRKYDIDIVIDSSNIVNDRFTGTIPDGGIQNALNILKWTSSFEYILQDSVIIIREK